MNGYRLGNGRCYNHNPRAIHVDPCGWQMTAEGPFLKAQREKVREIERNRDKLYDYDYAEDLLNWVSCDEKGNCRAN